MRLETREGKIPQKPNGNVPNDSHTSSATQPNRSGSYRIQTLKWLHKCRLHVLLHC